MCYETTEIGFKTFDSDKRVTVPATSEPIVARADGRRVLMFGPPSAGRVTIAPHAEVVDRQGFVMNWDDPPLMLRVEDHGDMVERAWHGISVAFDGPVVSTWQENGSADNSLLTVTHALAVGFRHYIYQVMASYDAAPGITELNLQVAAADVMTYQINNRFAGALADAIEGGSGESVGATLAASGTPGQFGFLALHGHTIDAGDGGIVLPIFQGTFKKKRLDSRQA